MKGIANSIHGNLISSLLASVRSRKLQNQIPNLVTRFNAMPMTNSR